MKTDETRLRQINTSLRKLENRDYKKIITVSDRTRRLSRLKNSILRVSVQDKRVFDIIQRYRAQLQTITMPSQMITMKVHRLENDVKDLVSISSDIHEFVEESGLVVERITKSIEDTKDCVAASVEQSSLADEYKKKAQRRKAIVVGSIVTIACVMSSGPLGLVCGLSGMKLGLVVVLVGGSTFAVTATL